MNKEKIDLNWDDEKKSGISETVKKLLASGISSAFMSEDQLKQYLQGLNLPKEVLVQVLKGAQKSKDDLMGKVGSEFSKLIQKIDIVKELKNVLQEHKISIQADIEFVPKKKKDEEKAELSE
ncbi:MAG: hypothetical protein HRT44_09435 [Bdellovibrionales bacterium]|nr:hypothetical protein [Bdellovibrionales bacterium]NQZ19462.1 hypothetical protein [Bdellovibrionales bacterium]